MDEDGRREGDGLNVDRWCVCGGFQGEGGGGVGLVVGNWWEAEEKCIRLVFVYIYILLYGYEHLP